MNRLAQEVASSCGFDFVPPVNVRRGRGGDWNQMTRRIRIGRGELRGDDDHLWYVVAHELAHAQAERREGHSRAFWVRLANGLEHAGKLELLRYDFGYREAALRVSEEYGLPDVPKREEFRLALGTVVEDGDGRGWKIVRRFRRTGAPCYWLQTRGWRWIASEQALLP
ncbi:MAG: M48 family metallopeptidase [Chloroflexi bacterium]|nr:M48 family metallopeptidase [Chloroflexota bacterium]